MGLKPILRTTGAMKVKFGVEEGTDPVIGTVCDNLIFQINSRFMMPLSMFDRKPEQS